ncbi:MAG: ATP-binding protein, partial [Muribaculaceae bacterium]
CRAQAQDPNYWTNNQNTHVFSSWSGLAFEMLCLNHFEQIKMALGITGITSNVFSWFGKGISCAAQIDMLIDRADRAVNICEMKYYSKEYALTSADEEDIERKVTAFSEATNTDKALIVTLISARGIVQNLHSACVQKQITLEQLFV